MNTKFKIRFTIIVILLLSMSLSTASKSAQDPYHTLAETTELVSVANDGTQGNGDSYGSSISADGRYVAFGSDATNLVDGDTNAVHDIFMHDRLMGETTRVSVASDGTQGNNDSLSLSISADGRYVSFESDASNLVDGDTNGYRDIFVHDLVMGETTRVSVTSDGTQGNQDSLWPDISVDGRYIAFGSLSSNLVDGDTNGAWDVFMHDRVTGETTRVSVASDGTQGDQWSESPSLSADGRYMAFFSLSSNLVNGDTNGSWDIFVHDRVMGETTRVSVASNGTQGNSDSYFPFISADGHYVAFFSDATNLVNGDSNGFEDIFVYDRDTGETTRVSVASDGTQGNNNSFLPVISDDGHYVAFESLATNLVDGDTNGTYDVFVHDRVTGETQRVSVASDGTQGNDSSWSSSISADGRYVAFTSAATNLVDEDTNGYKDVFVHERAVFSYRTYLPVTYR